MAEFVSPDRLGTFLDQVKALIPNYSKATTSTDGLMSSTDKSKLDGITEGATKVTVDTALSSTSTNLSLIHI